MYIIIRTLRNSLLIIKTIMVDRDTITTAVFASGICVTNSIVV